MNVMEILEPILRLMDNYPLTSIAFCLLIVLGIIAYKALSYIGLRTKN